MSPRPPLTTDQRARVAAAAVRQVRATLERQRMEHRETAGE
jgi:hypothetical protein